MTCYVSVTEICPGNKQEQKKERVSILSKLVQEKIRRGNENFTTCGKTRGGTQKEVMGPGRRGRDRALPDRI